MVITSSKALAHTAPPPSTTMLNYLSADPDVDSIRSWISIPSHVSVVQGSTLSTGSVVAVPLTLFTTLRVRAATVCRVTRSIAATASSLLAPQRLLDLYPSPLVPVDPTCSMLMNSASATRVST